MTHKSTRPGLMDIPRGLVSPDQQTRRMTVWFFVCLVGMGMICFLATLRIYHRLTAVKVGAGAQEDGQPETAEKPVKPEDLSIPLGSFTVGLKPMVGKKATKQAANMASIDIVFQCDEPKTREYIEKNMIRVRDQINRVFSVMDREELMSVEGKRDLSAKIIRAVNQWLPKGKIKKIFFSRFIVS
jgi:flagellar basal body-associated protein FliL